ncbi:Protein kinase alk2 [Dinochytrium kinnereticum]|nr:Protein kinase alk2 [Dinochytrium kinnereticum]
MSSSSRSTASAGNIIAAGAVAVGSALLYAYWDTPVFSSVRLNQKLQRPAGSLPIIGDAISVLWNLHRIHDWFQEIAEENSGRAVAVKIPLDDPIIFINDPAIVEHILKTNFHIYDKGPHFINRCKDVLGHGIFNVDGERWKSQRKTAANIFNVKNFKEFVGVVFAEEMHHFANRLALAASTSQKVNLQDLFFRFTLDGFARIGFGADLECMQKDEPIPFARAFDDAQNRMQYRFVQPLWWVEEVIGLAGVRQRENVKVIREFAMDIIAKRKEEIGEGEGGERKRNDLLAYLMEVKDENGNPPSDDELCDYVLNFIIAGRDTTAQALSWCFLLLHKNPHVLIQLREEIDSVLGPYGHPDSREYPTYEEVKSSMPFANAVFKETLRLYPSVPNEIKQANRDDVLPDGTKVPKGATVVWAPYTMGRTEKIWGPDAKQFNPSRWLAMTHQPSPYDYPVFNAGPRVCLGKNMAELEGAFVLISVARRFDLEVVGAERVTYANSLTLPVKGELEVLVRERK